ncbi:alanine--tRNA ligase [bacterium]|nr:alanine--tRNA ligase [bacterium]
MATASEVRKQFLDFFKSKAHKIVESAPIVVKNDPTLMFTNAGMNQFKDYFLGNKNAEETRVANTQKCLRVSGKHNDLEEVGVDTYHHTMFEMLGNWSFGDYFKEESIAWAWELLTEVYGLDKSRLYVTVFEGDPDDNLKADNEAVKIWEKYIKKDRILLFDKKDNFWEMGETGPCGPCSEIHMDLRPEADRNTVDGASLVNKDHDQVIELWNLVFMQYNRKADGTLVNLPSTHVDTGMGLERILRAVNGKHSNYDTDLFMDTIHKLEELSKKKYGEDEKIDIAFRVIADHVRAVSFAIADGQLPSNEKAGHVIRRILRRAIRYGYSFLGIEQPFICELIPGLASKFEATFPSLKAQEDFVKRVVEHEEHSFLQTLGNGLRIFDQYAARGEKTIDGKSAFELYDTFGFPKDLTDLVARERGMTVDSAGFEKELAIQRDRSRADAKKESGDWIVIREDEKEEFVGYDYLSTDVKLTRYREVKVKNKTKYHLVFNITPFYAESGGQVGDTGMVTGRNNGEKVEILDTQKENELIIQIADKLPEDKEQTFHAEVNGERRTNTAYNHSATHLLHAALKEVLGDHVNQKGSLVDPKHLRFDFSHFEKVKPEELERIETIVNQKIRASIPLLEERNVPYDEALNKGAMALFGEKYGDVVRVITFDPNYSVELCGGTHVANTAEIGSFKIKQETSVAAGVRRIEAITGARADQYVRDRLLKLEEIHALLGSPQDISKAIQSLMDNNAALKTELDKYQEKEVGQLKSSIISNKINKQGFEAITAKISLANAAQVKDLAYQIKNEVDPVFCALFADLEGKPNITVMISDSLVKERGLNAGQLVRDWAKKIKGGGGGQPFFAQAGGSDVSGLSEAEEEAKKYIESL